MKNRSKWQKDFYSRFWANQVLKYGFDNYCKGLFELVEKKKPSSVYELAIGTGWPFAISFYQKGIKVAGSDISEFLIKRINEEFPGIEANVNTYEDITPCESKYDIVYCFRSTWYFPDICKAIDSMFSLCKSGGSIVFDIMNSDSSYVRNIIRTHRVKFPYTVAKNVVKKLANFFLGKSYHIQDPWNIHELPVSPRVIEQYLEQKKIRYIKYSMNQIVDENEPFQTNGEDGSKIVYDCVAV